MVDYQKSKYTSVSILERITAVQISGGRQEFLLTLLGIAQRLAPLAEAGWRVHWRRV